MEIDPKKIDFDKMEPYQKSDGENMRSDLSTSESDCGENENIENANKNERADSLPVLTPLSENSGRAMACLLSPTELLSNAWRLYKSRWKTFLGIVAIPMLFFVISVFILSGFSIVAMGFLSSGIMYSDPFLILIPFSVLYLTMIIIWIWSQAVLIYAIKNSEEKIGIKELYKRGWHKLKPFFWVLILSNLIISGGFILFYIPGIIFSIWFSFAIYIVVAEDLKGMNAILKSREYVKGHWWQTLWRFLFIFLIVIGIFTGIALFSIAMMILTGILLSSIGEIANVIGPVLYLSNFILVVVAAMSIVPLTIIYLFLVYSDLKKISGDFEFKPSSKIKNILIVIAVLEPLIIMFGIISAFSSIYSVLNNAENNTTDIHSRSNIYEEDINSTEETFENSRDKQRILDLKLISLMIESCKIKNSYPLSHTATKLNEDNFIVRRIEVYNKNMEIPIDSKDPEYYYGYKSSDGKSFELTARLENIDDPRCDSEIKENSGICIYKYQN